MKVAYTREELDLVLLKHLARMVERLHESLSQKKTSIIRDAAIFRFFLCAELAWKTTKFYLENNLKVRCTSPKSCFREAYTQKLIEYENRWLDMMNDRNNVAHLYRESMADALFEKLPEYAKLLESLLARLQEKEA